MAVKTSERLRGGVARIGEEIQEKAWSVGRDPAAEKRKRLTWGILQAAVAATFSIGARRVGARLWGVLTGEAPPARR